MTTRAEAVSMCYHVMKSEGSFDPFMLYHSCLSAKQEEDWKTIMLPIFYKYLTNLPTEEFKDIQKRVETKYKL